MNYRKGEETRFVSKSAPCVTRQREDVWVHDVEYVNGVGFTVTMVFPVSEVPTLITRLQKALEEN